MEAKREEEIEMRIDEKMDETAHDRVNGQEIDFDYECDAPQFFDFTRQETEFESIQAESWFESAGSYPPSPSIAKLRLLQSMLLKKLESQESDKDVLKPTNAAADNTMAPIEIENSNSGEDKTGHPCPNQAASNVKTKSAGCKSSTLMKPTASHLAKQRKPREAKERFLSKSQATKRQKINSGYKHKGVYLKWKNSFRRKTPKEANGTVTIPKGPYLQTANRAQSRMLRVTSKIVERASCFFKARPLNRKILEAPLLAFRKKSTPQLPKFHARNVSGMISQQRSDAKCKGRLNSFTSSKHERRNRMDKTKKRDPLNKVVGCKERLRNLRKDLFNKLCLTPEKQVA